MVLVGGGFLFVCFGFGCCFGGFCLFICLVLIWEAELIITIYFLDAI